VSDLLTFAPNVVYVVLLSNFFGTSTLESSHSVIFKELVFNYMFLEDGL
jgi:hypothetical protein